MPNTYLNASEVAELAALLEDAPARVGVVDEVLQAASEGRGMTLRLHPAPPHAERANITPRGATDPSGGSAGGNGGA